MPNAVVILSKAKDLWIPASVCKSKMFKTTAYSLAPRCCSLRMLWEMDQAPTAREISSSQIFKLLVL
jgi:hypothetical protein